MSEVHKRIMDNIDDRFDKSDGSFIYDTTKAVALVVEEQIKQANNFIEKLDVEKLSGEELHRFVEQRTGIKWKAPTYATTEVQFTGASGTIVEVGELVAAEDVFYEVITPALINVHGWGQSTVRCQESGPIGNVPVGAINTMPVTIAGITSVTNPNAVTNGYAAETDDALRERYYNKIQRPGKAGNPYHYEEWANEVTGVGKVKVVPLWNGPLTVKVIILNINNELPSDELLQDVADHIETQRPFGATVTVDKPLTTVIDISVDITIALDAVLADVENKLIATLTAYLKSLAFAAEYVSVAQIGKMILETEGILDYTDLLLNNQTNNIVIADGYIPVLGEVTLL